MRAAIFEKPGIENLKIMQDVEQPKINGSKYTFHPPREKVNQKLNLVPKHERPRALE